MLIVEHTEHGAGRPPTKGAGGPGYDDPFHFYFSRGFKSVKGLAQRQSPRGATAKNFSIGEHLEKTKLPMRNETGGFESSVICVIPQPHHASNDIRPTIVLSSIPNSQTDAMIPETHFIFRLFAAPIAKADQPGFMQINTCKAFLGFIPRQASLVSGRRGRRACAGRPAGVNRLLKAPAKSAIIFHRFLPGANSPSLN
jgi:hypothetical protein